jgi:hypothetical protein
MDKSKVPGHMGDCFSLVVPDIFSIIISVFFVRYKKMCISLHALS